jgi:hypothetical protein
MKKYIQISTVLFISLATSTQYNIIPVYADSTIRIEKEDIVIANNPKIHLKPGEKVICIENDTRAYTPKHVAENISKKMASYRKGKPFCNQKDASNKYNQSVLCPGLVNIIYEPYEDIFGYYSVLCPKSTSRAQYDKQWNIVCDVLSVKRKSNYDVTCNPIQNGNMLKNTISRVCPNEIVTVQGWDSKYAKKKKQIRSDGLTYNINKFKCVI